MSSCNDGPAAADGADAPDAPDAPDAVDAPDAPDMAGVIRYFKGLQADLCRQLGELEPAVDFTEDVWTHAHGGGGSTRILQQGALFEKGGVNFSEVRGAALPASASAQRASIAGKPFAAAGVSLVMHPLNPYVPCCHLNVRFFSTDSEGAAGAGREPQWWFGGGYDLTPCYGFEEDCVHWHQTAKRVCDGFDPRHYPRFKAWCDEYFYLKHRHEARGIGGLFFDDYREGGFARAFAFLRGVGDSFIQAYRPIVERRRDTPYAEEQRRFQSYRRGRYVEFNLVYDRGTLFGLESGGRTESILMSLPPLVRWEYDRRAAPGSEEQKLTDYYLKPRDWAGSTPGSGSAEARNWLG